MSVVLSQILYISLLVQASLESCTFNGDAVNPGTVIISVNIILYYIVLLKSSIVKQLFKTIGSLLLCDQYSPVAEAVLLLYIFPP